MLVYVLRPYARGEHVALPPLAVLPEPSGVRQAEAWVPLEVELVRRERRKRLEPVDATYVAGGLLVLKDAAVPRVRDALSASVEFLPLLCAQEPLTLLNVVQVVDALDEEESHIKRFRSSGRVMAVDHHVFRPQALPSDGLFRVPQSRATTFCTEPTALLLRERLTGVNVQPVWEA